MNPCLHCNTAMEAINFISFISLFFSICCNFVHVRLCFSCVKFYLDAIEVVRPLQSLSAEEFFPRGDRYDGLRACVGESMCVELHKLRVFMVSVSQLIEVPYVLISVKVYV